MIWRYSEKEVKKKKIITKGITIIIIHVTNSNGTSRIGITKGQAPVLNPSSADKEQQQMAGIAGGGG